MNKKVHLGVTALLIVLLAAANDQPSPIPEYTQENRLKRPTDYREWIFLSSGYGMNYSAEAGGMQMFTNVFVPQWAYREFLKTGKWPNQTMFVVEERNAESKGSINQSGHFQTGTEGIGVEVKDEKRFPEKWAYFSFGEKNQPAEINPKEACWQCHESHAAVEHSFVQFYPTLKPVAEKFGTYKKQVAAP
jgi:hypothetical protein